MLRVLFFIEAVWIVCTFLYLFNNKILFGQITCDVHIPYDYVQSIKDFFFYWTQKADTIAISHFVIHLQKVLSHPPIKEYKKYL